MSVSSFSRKRFGPPALALFLAANTFPRASVFFHTHAGGEAPHVHGDGEALEEHDHEELAAGDRHHHDGHLARHGGSREAAFRDAKPTDRGHWHTQSPYPLALRVEAPSLVSPTTIDSLSRSPLPGFPGRFSLSTRARSPPATAYR